MRQTLRWAGSRKPRLCEALPPSKARHARRLRRSKTIDDGKRSEVHAATRRRGGGRRREAGRDRSREWDSEGRIAKSRDLCRALVASVERGHKFNVKTSAIKEREFGVGEQHEYWLFF
jgi:hypothetical protein